MRPIPYFTAWLDQYQELSPNLPYYRVFFALWILIAIVPRGEWLKTASDALLYPPPGTPLLVDSLPPAWIVEGLSILLAVFACLLLVGSFARFSALGIAAILLILNTWMYAFGKINHDILLIATPLILAFSGWGNSTQHSRTPISRSNARRGWLLALVAVVIGLAMLTAAIPKIESGWLSLEQLGARHHFLRNHVAIGRSALLTELLVGFDLKVFWILADYATVAVEFLFIFAVATPRLFRTACAVAALFHLQIYFLMDIPFSASIIAYAAFIRWEYLQRLGFTALGRDTTPAKEWVIRSGAASFGLLYGWIAVVYGNPFTELQVVFFGKPIAEAVILVAGGVMGVGYLLLRARELAAPRRELQ